MRKVTSLLAVASLVGVATLVLAGGSASAQSTCDFLTAGGLIIPPSGGKANLRATGGGPSGSATRRQLRERARRARPRLERHPTRLAVLAKTGARRVHRSP